MNFVDSGRGFCYDPFVLNIVTLFSFGRNI
jgi:hypothetical protein